MIVALSFRTTIPIHFVLQDDVVAFHFTRVYFLQVSLDIYTEAVSYCVNWVIFLHTRLLGRSRQDVVNIFFIEKGMRSTHPLMGAFSFRFKVDFTLNFRNINCRLLSVLMRYMYAYIIF